MEPPSLVAPPSAAECLVPWWAGVSAGVLMATRWLRPRNPRMLNGRAGIRRYGVSPGPRFRPTRLTRCCSGPRVRFESAALIRGRGPSSRSGRGPSNAPRPAASRGGPRPSTRRPRRSPHRPSRRVVARRENEPPGPGGFEQSVLPPALFDRCFASRAAGVTSEAELPSNRVGRIVFPLTYGYDPRQSCSANKGEQASVGPGGRATSASKSAGAH